MYPLNMTGPGFAVANSEAEHKALTAMGYGPPLVETVAYDDGTTATGVPPLPAESPAEPKRRGRPPKARE